MESSNALDLIKNAKSSIKHFKKLHKALESCDKYSWDGDDTQWIHIYAVTKNKKLQRELIEEFCFIDEEKEVE